MASADAVAARWVLVRERPRSPGLALFALSAAATAYAVLLTVLVPIVPRMAAILHEPMSTISLVLTLPLISGAVLTPLLGKYGDTHGKRRVMLGVLVLMTLGGVLGSSVQDFGVLLVARVAQGAASAVFPLGAAIIRDEFEAHKVRGALSVFGAMFSVGSGVGLVLGGVLAQNVDGYVTVLWFSTALSALALVAVLLFVTDRPSGRHGKADILGASLLSGALVCLLLPLSEGDAWGWGSPPTVGLFTATVVLVALWVRTERRAVDPLVDLELFLHRPMFTTNMAAMLIGIGQFVSFLGVSEFVQEPRHAAGYGFSASVLEAGLFILPSAVLQLAATPLVVILARRYDDRIPLVVGGLLGGAALLMFAAFHESVIVVLVASGLMGAGLGMAFTALPGRVVHSVPKSRSGIATAMNNIMRTIGQALGTAILTAVLATDRTGGTTIPHERAYVVGFVIAGVAALLGAPIVLLGAAHSPEVHNGPLDLLEQPETVPHPGV